MVNEFLNSPIFSGNPVPPEKHSHLMIVLIGALIFVLFVGIGFLLSRTNIQKQPIVPVQAGMTFEDLRAQQQAEIAAQIDAAVNTQTPDQIKAINDQLKKAKTTMTPEQNEQIINQLRASEI